MYKITFVIYQYTLYFQFVNIKNNVCYLILQLLYQKTYLNSFFEVKLPKYCNNRKTRNPLFYAGLQVYLPQHCLYLRPEPHGHGSFLPIFLHVLAFFHIRLIFVGYLCFRYFFSFDVLFYFRTN